MTSEGEPRPQQQAGGPMTDTERQAIRSECEALSIAYARAIDFNDQDALLDLFTEDGELDAGGRLVGRTAIAQAIAKRPRELRSRHVLTNLFVDVVSREEARGISYLTLYRHLGPESLGSSPVPLTGPFAVGHYEDRYRRTGQGWKFQRRRLHLAFRRASE